MRTIKISDAVWEAIAAKGKFGETEDDVLRREFEVDETTPKENLSSSRRGRGDVRYASKRMSARIERNNLVVTFEDGARNEWDLPKRSDKKGIRTIREKAVAFALAQGASDPGQTNAVRKALTDGGYHLTK